MTKQKREKNLLKGMKMSASKQFQISCLAFFVLRSQPFHFLSSKPVTLVALVSSWYQIFFHVPTHFVCFKCSFCHFTDDHKAATHSGHSISIPSPPPSANQRAGMHSPPPRRGPVREFSGTYESLPARSVQVLQSL